MGYQHKTGTENGHSHTAKKHIKYCKNYKNRIDKFPELSFYGEVKKFFKKSDYDDHMHSGDREDMAHSAFSESTVNIGIKFPLCSYKKLFCERSVPINKIFVNNIGNFSADKMNIISEGRTVMTGCFYRRKYDYGNK